MFLERKINIDNMFDKLSEAISSLNQQVDTVEKSFVEKRTQKTIEIKTHMESELKKLTDEVSLADYNPIEHHNKFTEMKINLDKLRSDEKNEKQRLKRDLYIKLIELMNQDPILDDQGEMKVNLEFVND